ncbi:MAG: hypothetical protein QM784_03205 [Polyangiaceae bacterium]
MSDEHSDPQASSPHASSPTESIPPPEEPRTPAWLSLVGLAMFIVLAGWLAVRCGAEGRTAPETQASATPSAQPVTQ